MKDNNLSQISYSGINEIVQMMGKIGEDNKLIGDTFEKTINGFRENKSLSSKVITPSMDNMISLIKNLNEQFKSDIEAYCNFLTKEVNEGYLKADQSIESVWNNLKDIYNK